ncbi:MAG: hypothetical protein LBB25_03105 [Holosporaceae bacterium]|jgi:phosphoserine phosphatase|nr:hypothetical protein [Holosporaceae bacterium]
MRPLCVDLDGTLLEEDVTLVAAKIYMKRSFFNLLKMIFWIARGGRAHLKHKLAQHVDLDTKRLNYNKELMEFILQRKTKGHKIFLATACNHVYARKVADYLGVFDGVFASNDRINLRARAKARTLTTVFGKRGFSYAGNSKDDILVWDESAECILVAPPEAVLKKMQRRNYLLFKERGKEK